MAGHRDLSLHYHPEIQEYVEAIRKERKVRRRSVTMKRRREIDCLVVNQINHLVTAILTHPQVVLTGHSLGGG